VLAATAPLAIASDRSAKLLQRIKSRQRAGNNDVALAAPKTTAQ